MNTYLSIETAEQALLNAGYKKITTLIDETGDASKKHVYGKNDLLATISECGNKIGAVSHMNVLSLSRAEISNILLTSGLSQMNIIDQLEDLCSIKEDVEWNPKSLSMSGDCNDNFDSLFLLKRLYDNFQDISFTNEYHYETDVKKMYENIFDQNLRDYFPSFAKEVNKPYALKKNKSEYLKWIWKDKNGDLVQIQDFFGDKAICSDLDNKSYSARLVDISYINSLTDKVLPVEKLYKTAYDICCSLCDKNGIETFLMQTGIDIDSTKIKPLPKTNIKAICGKSIFSNDINLSVSVPKNKNIRFRIYCDGLISSLTMDVSRFLKEDNANSFALTPKNLDINVYEYFTTCQNSIVYSLENYGKFLNEDEKK